jgi:uncharacterized protein (DUF1697 family)
MVKFIALLRGINVGGRRQVPMERLRALHDRLGHTNVVTYIQSGNVVFDAGADDQVELAESIEAAIVTEFGFEVPVMIRSAADLKAITAASPYTSADFDLARVAVAFLDRTPSREEQGRIDIETVRPEEFTIIGREVHLHCPDGFGRAKLTNSFLESRLGVVATTRNWKTVGKLRELSLRA